MLRVLSKFFVPCPNTSEFIHKIKSPLTAHTKATKASHELSPLASHLTPLLYKTHGFCWSLPFLMEFFFSLCQVRLHSYEKPEATLITTLCTMQALVYHCLYHCFRLFSKLLCCPFLFEVSGARDITKVTSCHLRGLIQCGIASEAV